MVLIMIRQKNIIANDIINEWKCNPNPNVAYDLCEKANGRIHHLLFREIVFPVIKKGIKNNIEQDVIAAIKCIQNIYSDKKIWEQIEYVSELEMLKRLILADCKNEWVIQKYIESSIDWLKYCIHEWPSGVLYGVNGANSKESDEILFLIKELQGMAINPKYIEFIKDVEEKTLIYKEMKGFG